MKFCQCVNLISSKKHSWKRTKPFQNIHPIGFKHIVKTHYFSCRLDHLAPARVHRGMACLCVAVHHPITQTRWPASVMEQEMRAFIRVLARVNLIEQKLRYRLKTEQRRYCMYSFGVKWNSNEGMIKDL